uniref:G-protein coupled receptor family C group 6 member A-like n=1 Tax=Pristiophorus japonicus TaxID=55135 RepID=UPI00398F2676
MFSTLVILAVSCWTFLFHSVRLCDIPDDIVGARAPGDIIIGGLFPVHEKVENLANRTQPGSLHCSGFGLSTFLQAQAMIYRIEQINNSTLLPGVKLGYEIYDTCSDVVAAIQATTRFLSKFNSSDSSVEVHCNYTDYIPIVKAVVGDAYSEISIVVARMLNLYLIPQISYASSAEILSDKARFASFLRTVPSDIHQTSAMAKLVRHFNWNWVGAIATDDAYGRNGISSFISCAQKLSICFDFRELIPVSENEQQSQKINAIAEKIKNSTAEVMIVFLRASLVVKLFTALIQQNVTKTWIASDSWSKSRQVVKMNHVERAGTILGFTFKGGNISNFKDYFKKSEMYPKAANKLLQAYFSYVILSNCSRTCRPGERKSTSSKNDCCYSCSLCTAGSYSEKTDSNDCMQCSENQWSEKGSSTCQNRTIEFLQWRDAVSVVIVTLATLGVLIICIIVILFTKHLSTPAVKAAGGWMCYIMLFSLLLGFVSVVLFIGEPSDCICKIRQPLFGISFTLCVSCILVKSFRIILAFSFNPIIHKKLKLVYKPVPIIIVITGIQVIICSTWLSLNTPKPVKSRNIPQIILLLCDEGSHVAFSVMLGYIALLACVCFVLAFKGRKAPEMYNEAKFITFSMLIYLIVWISFVVVYINTKASSKYASAIESIAILASIYSILCCNCFPTCYIVWFKKETNVESNYLTRIREHFKQKGQFVCPIANRKKNSEISLEEQPSSLVQVSADSEFECQVNQKCNHTSQIKNDQNQILESNCLRKRHKSW